MRLTFNPAITQPHIIRRPRRFITPRRQQFTRHRREWCSAHRQFTSDPRRLSRSASVSEDISRTTTTMAAIMVGSRITEFADKLRRN